MVSTSQPIPANLRSFIFKTKIRKCSEDVEMFIGFKINGQYIRWINTTGNLDMHGARFTDLEPYGEHDEICWHLQKICVQEKYYQYFKCIKNGKTIGGKIMEGETIYPFVVFKALNNNVQRVELETSLDIDSPCIISGKFS